MLTVEVPVFTWIANGSLGVGLIEDIVVITQYVGVHVNVPQVSSICASPIV